MNKYSKWITNIIITFFLVFVALLLTILIVYIVNNSFKDQDTILAGCIGFIGAIIGGAITYVGVNKTLEEQRKKEEIKALERKYFAIQEYILEFEEIRSEIGKMNVNIVALYNSSTYYDKKTLNDMIIKAVRDTSTKINNLRKNKEFIRKMEGLGYELYSHELSFLKDLDTLVMSLIAARNDILPPPKLHIIAFENIDKVIEEGNEKNAELHKLKLEIRKDISNF